MRIYLESSIGLSHAERKRIGGKETFCLWIFRYVLILILISRISSNFYFVHPPGGHLERDLRLYFVHPPGGRLERDLGLYFVHPPSIHCRQLSQHVSVYLLCLSVAIPVEFGLLICNLYKEII